MIINISIVTYGAVRGAPGYMVLGIGRGGAGESNGIEDALFKSKETSQMIKQQSNLKPKD